jgi:DNA primase
MNMIDVLDQHGLKYEKTNNPTEVVLQCTSGNHADNRPSMMYNLDKDIFHCWSCGFRGTKRKFLQSIGINTDIPFDSKQPFKIQKLKDKLNEIIYEDNMVMPEDARPVNGTFKNISSDTLKNFNAFFTEKLGLEDYVCFPVSQFGKIRFIEGRNRFTKSEKPKYYRRPAKARSVDMLYPLDKIKDKSHLILVEGIFDMLNMWDKGYENTVCVFGANNFNKPKLEILDRIGTTFVEILFDGDEAGKNGARKIADLLEKRFIQSKIINLAPGKDPGDLSQPELNMILPKDRYKNVK